MNGYDLAEEVFRNIGSTENHEISLEDTLRVISFWGFNNEASSTSKIGFVCYCAREKIRKILENALVWGNFTLFDEMVKNIQSRKPGYLDGYEKCAECIEPYLSDVGKKKLECMLMMVRSEAGRKE